MTRNFAITFLAILAAAMTLALLTTFARAHEAPSGWSYSVQCCSNKDCQEITPSAVRETPDGYVVTLTADQHMMVMAPWSVTYTVPYDDPRLRDAPDGVFHACISRQYEIAGRPEGGRLICLYVPPKGF